MIEDLPNDKLMCVWAYFYINSFMYENVLTHYVNFPHYWILDERPKFFMDNQHNDLKWFDLDEIAGKKGFRKYMKSYASWLIKEDKKND